MHDDTEALIFFVGRMYKILYNVNFLIHPTYVVNSWHIVAYKMHFITEFPFHYKTKIIKQRFLWLMLSAHVIRIQFPDHNLTKVLLTLILDEFDAKPLIFHTI